MRSDEVHAMLDLETLAVCPWAIILSVGAVAFRPNGEIVDKFYRNVDPKSCMDIGLIADPNVAEWWAHPDREEARKAFNTDKRPILDVIDEFGTWFNRNGCSRVWGHGASFDIPIWETACRFGKKPFPWHFKYVRDTRTVFDMADVEFSALKKEGAYHNALDDAINQTKALTDCLQALEVLS